MKLREFSLLATQIVSGIRFPPTFRGLALTKESSLEIVLEVEEVFGISIPTEDAERIRTAGDLHALVLKLTSSNEYDSERCLTAAVFYELRKSLRSVIRNEASIRPSSRISDVFPLFSRRRNWRAMRSMLKLDLPRLERPSWLTLIICVAVATITFPLFVYFKTMSQFNDLSSIALAIVGAAFVATVLNVLTLPLAAYPRNCSTVGDLVRELVGLNFKTLSARHSALSSSDVWNVIQAIISEQLNIDRTHIKPQARFVEDLDLD